MILDAKRSSLDSISFIKKNKKGRGIQNHLKTIDYTGSHPSISTQIVNIVTPGVSVGVFNDPSFLLNPGTDVAYSIDSMEQP